MVLAWENLRRFLWCWSSFCCCCCCSFVVSLYSHFLFDIIPHSSVTITRFLDPFCTFSPGHRRVICDTFIFQPFRHLLTASTTVLNGHFPQVFFTLRSFPTFWHNLLLSRFCWELAATFLKFAGFHTDPRNTDLAHLFVWFTVIHNLLYILSLYLCMSILQKLYLWWKLW